ncbi:MAG: FHA domain-containing protein [Methylotenera sp.]|uniref:FHA domain-containing protein n=1 Tax=Methylotenera sp. TaxID=2051956 RepID=UPI00248A13BB|nr:FHA domain-containing protein [Methylotenera sp.]MDI1310225.1 FHA domain-containing protein [Methylotenera sp.]
MAKLIFILEDKILNEFQLDKERTTIGRRPNNDIYIDNLAVSGEHAVILRNGDDYYIEDKESTNGTEVNNKLIKSYLLQSGDLISFGKHQLKFVMEATPHKQSPHNSAFEKTVFFRPAELTVMMKAQAQAQATSTAEESEVVVPEKIVIPEITETPTSGIVVGRIQVLNGSSIGRELTLNKALTTLGKTGLQVAVITKRSQGYFVTHVEGKVFPIVNGDSIGAQAYELRDHDVIQLAGVKMEFYLASINPS